MKMPTIRITRQQLAGFLQLGVLSVLIYYGVKLVFESLDPTKKKPGQLTEKEVLFRMGFCILNCPSGKLPLYLHLVTGSLPARENVVKNTSQYKE